MEDAYPRLYKEQKFGFMGIKQQTNKNNNKKMVIQHWVDGECGWIWEKFEER